MKKMLRNIAWSFRKFVPFFIFFTFITTSCQLPVMGEQPPCGGSTLQLGESTYQIKEVKTKSDGSLKISSNAPGIAYWVDQTDINHVFALSSTAENLALQTTQPEQAILSWGNCNSSTYILSVPQAGVPDINTILDQSFSGITIFVQGSNGFVIRGEFIGEEIQTFNTPDPTSMQAEIALLETIPSADKTTIMVKVSITNYGQENITLTENDVSLSIRDSIVTLLESEPALPRDIASGAIEPFSFTFSYPTEAGATLKVFSAEYELEGY